MDVKIRLERLTLDNVADGALEALFQRELAEAVKIFTDDSGCYDTRRVVAITCEVKLAHNVETGGTLVVVGSQRKDPKRKAVARSATVRRKGDTVGIFVEPDLQEPLPFTPAVRAVPEVE